MTRCNTATPQLTTPRENFSVAAGLRNTGRRTGRRRTDDTTTMRSIVQCRFSDSLCEGEGGCVWALIARALVTVIAIHDIRGAFSVVPCTNWQRGGENGVGGVA